MKNIIKKLLQIPYAFVLMNWAAMAGLYYFARGHETFWNSVQMGAAPPRRLRHI